MIVSPQDYEYLQAHLSAAPERPKAERPDPWTQLGKIYDSCAEFSVSRLPEPLPSPGPKTLSDAAILFRRAQKEHPIPVVLTKNPDRLSRRQKRMFGAMNRRLAKRAPTPKVEEAA